MEKKRVILDVDTGHDDAVAIMLARSLPDLLLEGISVTAGNQTLEKTLTNTLNLCDALDIKVPVFAGMQGPLVQELKTAERIHGKTGFDGPVFGPCAKKAEPKHAVQFIVETLQQNPPQTTTIIAVGPLSNIAMAIKLSPNIVSRVKDIVIMGGSMGFGNVSPSAEFNIYADPEAAHIVFSSGAPITMIGLDVTKKVQLDDEWFESFKKITGKTRDIFVASMSSYRDACKKYIGESPAMHDPCCVACVHDRSIFTFKKFRVDIELNGTHTRGRTVVDYSGVSQKSPNVEVALTVDPMRFWPLLENALRF